MAISLLFWTEGRAGGAKGSEHEGRVKMSHARIVELDFVLGFFGL